MKKLISCLSLLIGLPAGLYAQAGLNNNGASVVISSGTGITVPGSIVNQASGRLSNSGTINFGGNFTNNATFSGTSGTLHANGSSLQLIGGTGSIVTNNLTVNNSAGLRLSRLLGVTNQLLMSSGTLDLNNNNIELSTTGSIVNETATNRITDSDTTLNSGGYIEAIRTLNAPSAENPANLGLQITSAANMGLTTIRRGHDTQGGDIGSNVLRYYEVIPATNTGLNASVRFYYFDAENSGIAESALGVVTASSPYTTWTHLSRENADQVTNYVEKGSIQAFNRLALNGTGAPIIVYVRLDGSDANSGMFNTIAGAKRTVLAGFSTVADAGTVVVNDGTYSESAVNTRNVTVQTSGTVNLQTLTMNGAGKTLTLGSALNISEKLALQAGTVVSNGNLTLLSGASQTALIDDFSTGYSGTITGNITAQRYFSGIEGHRYLASPVTGAVLEQLGSPLRPVYYNEPQVTSASANIDAGWVTITDGNTILIPMVGYSGYYAAGTNLLSLTGTANTGAYSRTVTRTSSGNFTGFNVLGNPYPSPVSWSAIWNLNDNSNIHKTVYVWNNALGKAALYNFATNLTANGGSNEIAQGQAFRIRVNTVGYTTTFDLDNSVRLSTSSNNFLRKDVARVSEKLRLVLSSERDPAGYETVIHSVDDATEGIDAAYDGDFADHRKGDVIWSRAGDKRMTINALPELKDERTVPLGVEVKQPGQYTIAATEIESFAPGTTIYLEDRQLGKMVDLAKESSYTVHLNQSEQNRFFVHFDPAETSATSYINIYSVRNEVNVVYSDAATSKGTVTVINMLGQTLAEVKTETGQQQAVLPLNVPDGVYIIRVASEGGTVSRKVLLSPK